MHVGTDMEDEGEPLVVRLPITLEELATRLRRKPVDLIKPAFQHYGMVLTPKTSLTPGQIELLGRCLGLSIQVQDAMPRRRGPRSRAAAADPVDLPDRITVRLPLTVEELAAQLGCKPAVLIKVAFQDYGVMLTPHAALNANEVELIERGLCISIEIENADDAGP